MRVLGYTGSEAWSEEGREIVILNVAGALPGWLAVSLWLPVAATDQLCRADLTIPVALPRFLDSNRVCTQDDMDSLPQAVESGPPGSAAGLCTCHK